MSRQKTRRLLKMESREVIEEKLAFYKRGREFSSAKTLMES